MCIQLARQSDGCVSTHGKMELCAISILVVLHTMRSYDVAYWTAVDGKQYICWGLVVAELNELAAKVRLQPGQRRSRMDP